MAAPRGLGDPAEAARRRAMLGAPHMAPLRDYAAGLRDVGGDAEVPDFDPLDGGAAARLLFVLEKPGPRTSLRGGGSGFVSRDNDDPTAAAAWRFHREAGLPRGETVIWNTCPWWNGTTRYGAEEMRRGAAALPALLDLLPSLAGAVCVGKAAERHAGPVLAARGLGVWASAHPSGQVRAAFPDRWAAIPRVWAEAARALS